MSEVDSINTDTEEDDSSTSIRYEIATYPSDLTIQVLKDMWDNGDIVIPYYQRNFVWTINQASLLIDSFLLGLPVPQAFFILTKNTKILLLMGNRE